MQYNPQNGQPYPTQNAYQHANGGMPYGGGQPGQHRPASQGGKPSPSKKPKAKKSASFYVAVVIAVVALIAAGVFAWMMLNPPEKTSRNGGAILGQVEGKSEAEIQAELDRIIEEGMFNISIASVATFKNGNAEGDIKIENVPNNPYLMQVVINRNDTGEEIYKSDIIEPNYHIQTAKLDKVLPKGTYECTATFHALDKENEAEVGQAAAIMTIVVEN